ncbi:MAG: cytochrome C oxidase subunit IV family protein [Bdellovibrionales bacterium]|nr:cytochrome C oxidase subunit IV family protein [Bdellovibrionales bacterium]
MSQSSHGDSEHHVVPLSSYQKVLGALLVLTVLTVAVAKPVSGFDAGMFNTFIAFSIATIKAVLVLAIFMGLKYDKKLYLVIFLTGIFFLIVMFSFSVLDIYTRIYVNPTL